MGSLILLLAGFLDVSIALRLIASIVVFNFNDVGSVRLRLLRQLPLYIENLYVLLLNLGVLLLVAMKKLFK